MSSIVRLLDFRERLGESTLILVDLHRKPDGDSLAGTAGVLENCRAALGHARKMNMPVAFVRRVEAARTPWAAVPYPAWIEGLEPTRSDMVFDRHKPSCYASPEFADMAKYTGGHYVLAGLFGESSCLSTVVDAFHRDHLFTFLADASISNAHHGISSADMHSSVAAILSLYGNVLQTETWIRMTSQKAGASG